MSRDDSRPPAAGDAPPPLLSVVVVNWNGGEHLPPLAASLLSQEFRDFEVVLLDNGSSDGSPDLAERLFAGRCPFRLVRSRENLGFAGGNNEALRHVHPRSPLALLLNNDTVVLPGCLDALVEAAGRRPGFDVFTPCVLQPGRPGKVDTEGIALSLRGKGRERRRGRAPSGGREVEVFGAPGSALLFRRSLLAPGEALFDERFFFNNEDVELALRWSLRGRRTLLVPSARVVHAGSASSSRVPAFRLRHIYRNEEWVFARLPLPWLLLLLPFRAADLLFALGKAWRGGNLPLFLEAKGEAFRRWREVRGGRERGRPGTVLRLGRFLLG